MIDPDPVEIPDEAELIHVALAEPVEVVEVIVELDVTVTVTADLADDDDDDLEYLPGFLLYIGRTPDQIHHNLGQLARRLDPALDAHLKQIEAQVVEGAVEMLRREIADPDQFGP
jgi:hypothetical protein